MSLTGRFKAERSASFFHHGGATMTEETTKPQTWQEKLAQKFWAVKVGERAENLRQAAAKFDNVNSLTMATREKLMGKEIVDNNRPEAEDMHIGDDNRVTNQYLPQQASGSTAGTLAKLAIGAGLLATGVGVPVGGWMIADALKNRPAQTTPNEDTNTQYTMDLVK